ncbi:hypothetical protein ACHAWX_000897 [Stephanocyclus meneghinianus]
MMGLLTVICTTAAVSSSPLLSKPDVIPSIVSTWAPDSAPLSKSAIVSHLRGGSDVIEDSAGDQLTSPTKKKKAKAGKKYASAQIGIGATDDEEDAKKDSAKRAISEAMKETDAATALGNAIRDRADILLQDKLPFSERTFDAALVSLGLSLGTAGTDSDDSERTADKPIETMAYYQYGHRSSIYPHNSRMSNQQFVQPSTSAVIANYFLKTHGGTHAVQCLLSLLASILGVACLLLPSFPTAGTAALAAAQSTKAVVDAQKLSRAILLGATKCQLLQQTLLLAVAKHASGLIGALLLGASKIPELGIRNTRRHLELVASDPVGQYLFYCSLLVVWMSWFGGSGGDGMAGYIARLKGTVISIMNASVGAGDSQEQSLAATELLNALSKNPPPWYLSQSHGGSLIPNIILAPILLREIISIIWVTSDVLTLVLASSVGITGRLMHGVLSSCRSIIDAFMSILITSDKWRKADSFQRQRLLAKLVSQCSLGMELVMGAVLIGDAIQSFWKFAFLGPNVALGSDGNVANGSSPPFKVVLGKTVCAHFYLNFLLTRRRKIQVLVGSIRGGAFLDRVLDILIDPKKEMGLAGGEGSET